MDFLEMYLKGFSISDIARTHGVTRQTVYKKKAKDKEDGTDWDALALNKKQDPKDIKLSEEGFLITLINSFERAYKELESLELKEQLALLKEYADTYYKLKAPIKTDCKAQILEAVTRAINDIADLATKLKKDEVTDFLAKNADEILTKVFKK